MERIGGQLRIRIRYRQYATDWFNYLLVSKEEMKKLLNGSGWEVSKFIDSPTPEYIAILKKNELMYI